MIYLKEPPKNPQNLHYIAQVKTPFFEGNHLKTIISWNDHPSCNDNKLLENQLRVYYLTLGHYLFGTLSASISSVC